MFPCHYRTKLNITGFISLFKVTISSNL